MKKLILAAALLFSFGAFAQQEKTSREDHLMMKDGKMWIVKNGTPTAMNTEITTGNGTKVSRKGRVVKQSGATWMLRNGDIIDMDGKVTEYVPVTGDRPIVRN